MTFPINDLLACFLEALDLHLKLGAGSGRNSSHSSIMHMWGEFHLFQLPLSLEGLGVSQGQVGVELCKSELSVKK